MVLHPATYCWEGRRTASCSHVVWPLNWWPHNTWIMPIMPLVVMMYSWMTVVLASPYEGWIYAISRAFGSVWCLNVAQAYYSSQLHWCIMTIEGMMHYSTMQQRVKQSTPATTRNYWKPKFTITLWHSEGNDSTHQQYNHLQFKHLGTMTINQLPS